MKAPFLLPITLAIVVCAGGFFQLKSNPQKRIIGQTEIVAIPDASLKLPARVDTGAQTTSVHAENIKVTNQTVQFDLISEQGERIPMRLPVAKTSKVRSANGSEERIFVELTLELDGNTKPVLVNLKDRSRMTYPLLLGRNWLENDYVVDVSQEPVIPEDI